jgi:hypothetical protein
MRRALERAKRFRAKVSAQAGEQQPSRLEPHRASLANGQRRMQMREYKGRPRKRGRSRPEQPVRQTKGGNRGFGPAVAASIGGGCFPSTTATRSPPAPNLNAPKVSVPPR